MRKFLFSAALCLSIMVSKPAPAVVLYTTVEELEQAAPSAGGGKTLAPQSSWTHSNLTKKIEPRPASERPNVPSTKSMPQQSISQQVLPIEKEVEKTEAKPSWAYRKSLDTDVVEGNDAGYPQTNSPRIYAEPVISTLGLGADVGLYVSEKVGLHLNANYLSYKSSSIKYESVDVTPEFRFLTVGVVGDYYYDGGFFVSGGVYYNGNRVSARGNVTDEVKINEVTYTKYDVSSISGSIEFNKFAPYIGGGFRGQITKDWFGMFELGALIHGSPQSEFKYVIANEEVRQQLESDIAAEINSFNDDIGRFIIMPVIKFGATYRFN